MNFIFYYCITNLVKLQLRRLSMKITNLCVFTLMNVVRMKFVRGIILSLFGVIATFNQVQAQEQSILSSIPVLVQYQQQWRGYFTPPRLSEVLEKQVKSQDIYWPSTQLFQIDEMHTSNIEKIRGNVLEQLRLLIIASADEPIVAMQLQEMRMQIARWQLAKPVQLKISPQLALLNQMNNPRLDAGKYLLVAGKRVGTVAVFGFGGERFFQHEQLKPAYQYVVDANSSEQVLPDSVLLFQVAKPVKQIPVASWNRTETAISTGSIIFVPLPAALVANVFPKLNQEIEQLLTHRVPL